MVSPSCHRRLMPSASSSWTPAGGTNLHLLTPGWISGWRPKGKAFNGVKKLVLTQWNPAAVSQCWCHSQDRSLCDTTRAWHSQTPVPWASRAWTLHLQFQGGGVNHARQSPMPEGSLSAAKQQRCYPRWHLYQVAETEELLQLCSPCNH